MPRTGAAGGHFPSPMGRMLARIGWREIAPKRAAAIYDEYDRRRGYAAYGELCRAASARKPGARDQDRLSSKGFAYLRLIGSDAARGLRERLAAEHDLSCVKKNDRNLLGFRITDRERIRGLLRTLITPQADAQFLRYFQSEYLVHTIACTLTPKAERQDVVSFRWHCDKGPRKHLKMIVYLNASERHGGNTEFIDLADTASVARRGYLFGRSKARTGDLGRLSRIAGQSLRSHSQPMQAGDAVIFQPALVLHRGISPAKGDRLAITLCLLPSPVPWEEALNRGALTDLALSEKWHRHANALLRRLGGGLLAQRSALGRHGDRSRPPGQSARS